MTQHLIVMVIAAVVTASVTPFVRKMSTRYGAVDVPDDRKVHKAPTPTLGGVAIFAGILVAMIAAMFMGTFKNLFQLSEPTGVMVGATIVMLVGVVDDVRGLKAPTKLAGQILGAGALALGGVQVFFFWLPKIGLISLSQDLGVLLTVIWTIAVINGVNLIDGLDGLAAGVTAIAAGALFVYAFQASHGEATTATLVPALIFGSCIGFLPHNFNPAKIFMGDSGSMPLGLLLAASTVSGVGRTVDPRFSDVAGLVVPVLMIPLLVLAVPLGDMAFAIVRRARAGAPVFHADKNHIHHRLLEIARSHRQAVLVIYSWTAMLASALMVLSIGVGPGPRVVAIVMGLVLIASIVSLPRVLRRGSMWPSVEQSTAPPPPPSRESATE